MKAFLLEVYYYFPVSSKCAGALNEMFDGIEMEGSKRFSCVPTEWLLLLPDIGKMLKCWIAVIFKS